MPIGPSDTTPDPTEPLSVGERVALELAALVQEMAEHRAAVCDREANLTGLIHMLSRRGAVLEAEHVEKIADHVKAGGDAEHELGSAMYRRSDRIRGAVGKGTP